PLVLAHFSPDDRYVALPTKTGVDIWDLSRFEKIGSWQPAAFSYLDSVSWSPTADRFVGTFTEKTSATTGREHSFLIDRQGNEIAKINGTCAAFSPSGDRIAIMFGPLMILDGQTGSPLTIVGFPPHGGHSATPVLNHQSIWFSPDGEWLF